MLAEFTDRALDAGAVALSAIATRAEQFVVGGVLRQLEQQLAGSQATQAPISADTLHALRAPVVVVVDDAQHCDEESLRVLGTLRGGAVSVVFAQVEPAPALVLPADERVRLVPLSQAGVAEVLGDAGPAASVHRVSGGNPVLVQALAADAPAEPGEGPSFRQAVPGVLRRWGGAVPAVAEALAVLGDGAQPAVVAEVAGVPAPRVSDTCAALASAGLVAGGRIRHEAVRSAVLAGLSRADRAELHLRAAKALHEAGVAPQGVAEQLVAAGAAEPWALPVLAVAAQESQDAGFAVRCREVALGAVPAAQRQSAVDALAAAEWRLRSQARLGEPVEDPVVAARYGLWHTDRAGAADLLAAAQRADPAAGARLALAEAHLRASPAPAAHPDADWAHAAARLLPNLLAGALPAVADDAEHLLRTCPPADDTLEIRAGALLCLTHADRPDLAAQWCDALLDDATARGATTWRAVFVAVQAEIALRQGAVRTARTRVEQALRLLPPPAWGVLLCLPLSTLLSAETALGLTDGDALRHVLPDGALDSTYGPKYLHARGEHYLAADRVLAASADFEECGRRMVAAGRDLPSLAPWRTGLAAALLRTGHPRAAAALADEQLAMPAAASHHVRGLCLRVQAGARGPDHLRQAAKEFHAAGNHLAAAIALAELSRSLFAQGNPTAAAVATASLEDANRCGAADLLERVLRGDEPQGQPEPPALSEAENRVAALAALGHTNREIAQRLEVTPSTVEQHLTRVFRKLGIHHRADLPASPCVSPLPE
ncbi:hypothetical protein BJP25_26845 [Actinokineospora bangkokensis]|uniref:HTH luxR-type domain-containing protein n=1 Tax=Actinokineospora bangkokensis TaxID=1193682 RepID=A0A1Q9LGW3_9PSEU|nr:hypothetical protein BJP25_26845 [Actinokineospora bangkokensis]